MLRIICFMGICLVWNACGKGDVSSSSSAAAESGGSGLFSETNAGGGDPNAPIELAARDASGRENFEAFYIRFLRDSAFQMQRIRQPLPVIEDFAFKPGAVPVMWELSKWSIQRQVNDPGVESRFQPIGDDMVAEHIYVSKMYYLRRDFSYDTQKKQWMLYSYTGMQELASIIDPSRPQSIQPKDAPEVNLVVHGDTLR